MHESGIAATLSPLQQRMQECLFELVTSEASYLRSLNVFITHFMAAAPLGRYGALLTQPQRRSLFSNILAVRDASEQLVRDFERLVGDAVLLDARICAAFGDNMLRFADEFVKYCSYQAHQDAVFKLLK